jgi:DNA replication protein DnaC
MRRDGLIIVDEVGYLRFEQDAANLFFQSVSSRYERASLILKTNLPFSGWGDPESIPQSRNPHRHGDLAEAGKHRPEVDHFDASRRGEL